MDKRFSILVVDNETINLQLISSALKDKYDIHTVLDGHDAIRLIKEYKIDLILMDVMMPDFDGFQVCKLIKANPTFADIPVIFITVLDTRGAMHQGFDAGGIDYLSKPVDLDLLKLRVRNHLVMKEQRDLLVQRNEELETALAHIKQLEGIIPICSFCKNFMNGFSTLNSEYS